MKGSPSIGLETHTPASWKLHQKHKSSKETRLLIGLSESSTPFDELRELLRDLDLQLLKEQAIDKKLAHCWPHNGVEKSTLLMLITY